MGHQGKYIQYGMFQKCLIGSFLFHFQVDDDDIEAKMAEIRQHPDVLSVEQDGIGKILSQ